MLGGKLGGMLGGMLGEKLGGKLGGISTGRAVLADILRPTAGAVPADSPAAVDGSDCGAALENERYSDRVVLDAVVPVEREREFLRRVRETFSATVTPESGELISRPVAI